jgi:ketosteroid isomerase-like protein
LRPVSAAEDLVRRAYDAANRRDYETLATLMDPEFEMDFTDRVFNPGTYRGEAGLRQFMDEVDELWESMDMKVDRMLDRGDEVLAIGVLTLKGRGSGLALENPIAQRWWLRDGRLLRLYATPDVERALAEFGAA